MNKSYESLDPLAFFVYQKYQNILKYLYVNIQFPISRRELTRSIKKSIADLRVERDIVKKLIQYKFLKEDIDDLVYLTDSYKLVQEYLKDQNKTLCDHFDSLLIPVADKHLKEVEEYCNEEKHKIALSLEQLQKIKNIAYSLKQLEKNKINTKNYGQKVNAYNALKDKALDSFGILLPEKIPFSNPKDLYVKIDIILYKAKFTKSQRNHFYRIYLNRKLPDQGHITTEKLLELQKVYEKLPLLERYLIIQLYNESDQYLRSTVGEEAKIFLDHLDTLCSLENFKEFIQSNIDMIDEKNQIIHKHLFQTIKKQELSYKHSEELQMRKKFMDPNYIKSELSNI